MLLLSGFTSNMGCLRPKTIEKLLRIIAKIWLAVQPSVDDFFINSLLLAAGC
jgi:hypothetical protein